MIDVLFQMSTFLSYFRFGKEDDCKYTLLLVEKNEEKDEIVEKI